MRLLLPNAIMPNCLWTALMPPGLDLKPPRRLSLERSASNKRATISMETNDVVLSWFVFPPPQLTSKVMG